MNITKYRTYFQVGLLLTAATLSSRAGSFNNSFDTGALPAGTHTNATGSGGAFLDVTGGVGDSGCLKLTKNINDQHGSFILDDLDSGNPIYGFDITFKVRIGGGSSPPADGLAVCVAPDLTDTSNFGETGAGSGVRLCWGIYPFTGEIPPPPALRVRVGGGGNIVWYKNYPGTTMETGGTDPSTWWGDVHIRLNPDGSLSWDYKGVNVLTNFWLPGYQDFANLGVPVRVGFGARTGGANENFWIDNLQITTFTLPMVGISQQPFSQTGIAGDDVTFDVRVANVNGASYQWFSNNVAIPGANSQTLTLANVQPAASGSKYKVTITGPNNAVTSSEATLTVTTLTLPGSPQLSYNFDDGLVPAGTATFGNALVQTFGGIGGSGSLQLTIAANDESGAFVVTDPAAGAPVYGFTARFKMLVGGGTTPPADGFAFAFGTDIPADPTSTRPEFEQGSGLGSGLVVTFDIFNNDGIVGFTNVENPPAPSIDVRYGGVVLGSVQLPLSVMESGDQFGDTIIQLNVDGTLNVVYRGVLVFNHLPVPGFSSLTGGNFAVAARTGGLNDNMFVDNFELTTVTTPGALRIVTQPANQTVLVNHPATFSVTVNDAAGTTYQWFRGASTIGGATASSYTLPSAVIGDSGATFSVQATKGTTVTSTSATLTVVNLVPPASPQLSYNFNDGLVPAGTHVYGSSYVSVNGGVGDTGVLHVNDATNGASGAFVVSNLVFNGAQVSAIAAAFDVFEGGGSAVPADGFSFNWAAGLPEGTVGDGENGAFNGTGLAITFRIYVGNGNADNPPSPYIGVRYKGNFVSTIQIPAAQLLTGTDFRTMLLRVDQDGKLYLSYGERVLFNGLQLPNYTFTSNSKFGFYGRTGGLNVNQWFDNVRIQATQSSGPLAITTQPANAIVVVGQTASFNVALTDPNGATYQWFKNNTSIGGATASSYTTPATVIGDSGALFKVTANGPGGSITSSNAVLTVVPAITISSPNIVYDFNDCALPPDTILNGTGDVNLGIGGYIDCSGGVGNSGVLKLTDAINSEGGTFIISDFNTNQPVKAFTAYFAARVGGGTAPPADGFAFVWCPSNDLPNNIIFSEDGTGTGLIVGFDIFDNGNETPPAPSVDLIYHGARIATKHFTYQQLETGSNFGDTYIRVSATGVVDVQYNNMVVFSGVQLPGYTALAGGEFALGARTGGLNENQWFDNIQIATTIGLVPVQLSFTKVGTDLRFTWPTGWKLQSTANLSSPNWQDVLGATSPYLASTLVGNQYFRLVPTP